MDKFNLHPDYIAEKYFSSGSTDCIFKQILLACHEFISVSELEDAKYDVDILVSSDLLIYDINNAVVEIFNNMGFYEYKNIANTFIFSANGHNLVITRLPSLRPKTDRETIYFYDPKLEDMVYSFLYENRMLGIKLSYISI